MADKELLKNSANNAVIGQKELKFFGPGTDCGNGSAIEPPTAEEINAFLDRKNPDGPFYGYFGNDEAIDKLSDMLFEALFKPNHNAGPNGIALIGSASTGKTTLAKMMATKGLKLPFVECDRSVKNTSDLLERLMDVLKQSGVPLVSCGGGSISRYKCPPCVIYFDEAHAIRGDWLLKATERNDATLITNDAICNCRNVLWIISTTHRGKLHKAFDTRFSKIFLNPYTIDQVAEMVKSVHNDLPSDVCRIIASYSGQIPRQALDFAREVKTAALRRSEMTWSQICKYVGDRNGINEEGFTTQHLKLLAALFNNRSTDNSNECAPLATKRVADQIGVEEIDLEQFVLPPLQISTADRQPLVRTTTKGLEITPQGIESLRRWGIIKKKSEKKSENKNNSGSTDFLDGIRVAARSIPV